MMKKYFTLFLTLVFLLQLAPSVQAASTGDRTEDTDSYATSYSESTDLLFDFSNDSAAKARYNTSAYGKYNFDNESNGYWATGYNGSYTAWSISNDSGTLRMDVTDGYSGSTSSGNQTYGPWLKVTNTYGKLPSYDTSSQAYYPLNYTPTNAQSIQIRFRLTNCQIASGKTPRVVFEYYYTKNGAYGYKNNISAEYSFQSGMYQTLTIPLDDTFRSADKIKGFGLRFQHIYSTASNGTMSIDYIYIGSNEGYAVKEDYADFTFKSQMTTVLTTGVKEMAVRLKNRDNEQVAGYFATISPTAKVTLKASYPGYYTPGSTPSSRAEKAGSMPFQGARPTVQAASYTATTGQDVYVATTANFLNGEDFHTRGYLVMEGNIVQTYYSLKTPYLAVLKDGSFEIRPYGTPLGDAQEVISGYQWLVRNGEIATTDDSERHPRTAMGLKADGTLVVFVADGRQEPYSVGMTFVELAQTMQAAGCVDAINFDGGGSATFATTYQGTKNLELRNRPSDETGERVLGASMLIVPVECRHDITNAKYTDNGDGTHSTSCNLCSEVFTYEHSYYSSGICVCKAQKADHQGLFFGFSGSSEALERYIHPDYGYYNYDMTTGGGWGRGYWATRNNGENDSFVVDNATGTLTLDVTKEYTENSDGSNRVYGPKLCLTSGYGVPPTSTSYHLYPLKYDPSNIESVQVRFKLTNCTAVEGKVPELMFEYYYQKDGEYKLKTNMLAEYKLVNDQYITVTIPASKELLSADVLRSFNLRFRNIMSSSGGKVTVDYIYIGEHGTDTLFFDFKNDSAAEKRYSDVAYNFNNFDKTKNGYWATAYNGGYSSYAISNTLGVLNLTVTDNTDLSGRYGPWLKLTGTYGTFPKESTYDQFPLSYDPSDAEYVQIRVKHTNCAVPDGKQANIVMESYCLKDGSYYKVNNMQYSYDIEDGVYQTFTIPVSSSFATADEVKCFGFRFQNVYSTGSGKMSFDYIYVGSLEGLPRDTCKVKFLDEDGTILDEQTVLKGASVTYRGVEPTKSADSEYHYTFSGWNGEMSSVKADLTLTAQYSAEAHSYVDGTCICGAIGSNEPVLDADLTFTMSISVGSEMQVKYTIPSSRVKNFTSFYLEVVKEVYGSESVATIYSLENENLELTYHPVSGAVVGYAATYTGIFASQMGDNFTATLYAVSADGTTYYGNSVTSSIKDSLYEKIETGSAELKTLAVDMLNYGAAAQIFFDYNTENLVNSDLTEEQKALGTQVMPSAIDNSSITGDGCKVATSVSLQSKVLLYINCTYTSNADSNLKFVIKDLEGKVIDEFVPSMINARVCQGIYDNVGAKQMRDLVTIELQDNGVTVSKIVTWNIESYVAQTRATSTEEAKINAVNAMLIYGDSAAIYLESTGQ